MLPSFSFGAEGVEYGRSSAYYATTAGSAVFPNDVDVKGNLSVQGFTSLDDTQVSGTLTVAQGLTGGTRTAYFTNGAVVPAEKSVAIFNDQSLGTLMVMRNNGNEGSVAFDGGVTGGQFVLTRPLTLPSGGGSSGNLTVGGAATVAGSLGVTGNLTGSNVLVNGGIYGGSLTSPVSAPAGLSSGPVTSSNLVTYTQTNTIPPVGGPEIPFFTITLPGFYIITQTQSGTAGTVGTTPYQTFEFVLVWRTPGNGLLNYSVGPILGPGSGFAVNFSPNINVNGLTDIAVTVNQSSGNVVDCVTTITRIAGGV